jgi:hypothetical protein
MTEDLGSHHRDTLKRLFADPASGNIEWREVRSLLETVGAASEEPNGALHHEQALLVGLATRDPRRSLDCF